MTAFIIVVVAWFLFGAIVNLVSIGININDSESGGSKILASAILTIFYLGMATWGLILLVS